MPFPDFTPTFPELLRRASRFGDRTYLVADADRIGKGSRVGVLIPNSVDAAVVHLALLRIGAVLVPVNTFLQTRELGWTIRHADLTELLVHPRFLTNDYLERLEAALPGLADQSADGRLLLPDAPFLR